MVNSILDIKNLKIHYSLKGGIFFPKEIGRVNAVDDVTFSIFSGETFSIVGESGSGKSTIAKSIVGLGDNISGEIIFNDIDIYSCKSKDLMKARRNIGMVFQDPYGSLNPKKRVSDIIGEALKVHKLYKNVDEYISRVKNLIKMVGLSESYLNRYPHEFSGGQRQRISIARAIATEPDLLILDEPVSALDVSIQAQILNLLRKLQIDLGIAYLFISHDLSIVRHISDRVAVMYLGKIVEISESKNIFNSPRHPYTKALLSAVPEPDPELEKNKEIIILKGELPSNIDRPNGCFFRTRCPNPSKECSEGKIEMGLVEVTPGHWVDKCCMNCS